MEVDARTGTIDLFALAEPRPSVGLPSKTGLCTQAQAGAFADRAVRLIGHPPNARRVRLFLEDPAPGSSLRAYVSATYQEGDGTKLHLVFDRITGRLENLIRTPPHTRRLR